MIALLEKKLPEIADACSKFPVKALYVFGSASRGDDFTEDSDIDLLYEMDYSGFSTKNVNDYPFDPFIVYCDLKEKLEQLLDRKIDLIPNQDFKNKYFKDAVTFSKKMIYGRA